MDSPRTAPLPVAALNRKRAVMTAIFAAFWLGLGLLNLGGGRRWFGLAWIAFAVAWVGRTIVLWKGDASPAARKVGWIVVMFAVAAAIGFLVLSRLAR